MSDFDITRPLLPAPLGELPSRVGMPGRVDDRRLSSPVLGIITAGQLRSLDNTGGLNLGAMGGIPTTWTAGINFENTSLGSMTQYLNFNATAGISFLKHPRLDLRHSGDAFFYGQLDVTESEASGALWDAAILLRDPALAHGITTIVPTNVYALFTDVTPSLGGLRIEAFTNTNFPTNPTMLLGLTMAPTAVAPGFVIETYVKSGATRATMGVGSGLTVFSIFAGDMALGTNLFKVEASGRVTVPASTLVTMASNVTVAGLNLPHGTAPAAPVDGDVWTTTTGLFARINGATVGPFATGGATVIYTPSTPATLSSDQNDYALPSAYVIRLSADATRIITGFAAGTNGQLYKLVNVGAHPIVISNLSTSSSSANRVITSSGTSIILYVNDTLLLLYDGTISKWRVL